MTATWDPIPPEVTHTTEQFWLATRLKKLVIQRCFTCGSFQHYPRPVCLTCGSGSPTFVSVSGRGTVASWTTVFRSPDPDRFDAPYTIGLVDLEEGPRLLTRLIGTPKIDGAVEVSWHPLEDGRHLPVFEMKE